MNDPGRFSINHDQIGFLALKYAAAFAAEAQEP
jgi:hypothetical protein